TGAFPDDVDAQVFWGEAGVDQAVRAAQSGATAILTTSDLIALRVRSELMRAQLSVPNRISLTGFDDMSFAAIMHPALTTVAQNVDEIARRAVDILTAKIRGETHPLDGKTVPMRLVVRQSTTIAKHPAKRRHPK
ncbi:MAG: substrate-binding domain-containing protein, partial [Pseudomonadota bacterium]